METEREFIIEILKHLGELDYIEPGSIPDIDLYMDQVTTFMDSHLEHSKRYPEDKILTKTMINNYAKNDLLPPPEKKKYTKDHMLILTWIYYYKNLLSISDIETLLGPLKEYYFAKDGDHNLEDVYERVYDLCRKQRNSYVKDILNKYKAACEEFPGENEGEADSDETDYIRKFSFLCLLGFDIYLKKVVMEQVVDEMREKEQQKNGKDKKEKKQ
jgi:hypothetical protein